MRRRGGLVAPAALALALALPSGPRAQGIALGGQSNNLPIEIEADQGIEWQRDLQIYLARGNAKATRGEITVYGDTLTAHYRPRAGAKAQAANAKAGNAQSTSDNPTGSTEIYQLEANGNVRIATPTETAYADRAVYDTDQSVIVLLGRNLKLETKTDVLTARDSLEYWDKRLLAVARGNAVASRTNEDKSIRADTLSAQFGEVTGQGQKLQRVDAFGNVEVRTALEVARGEKGVYLADRELATLIGNVRITRGDNQLNGDVAEVDMKTGVSRLLNTAGGQARVRGLFVPDRGQNAPAGGKPAAGGQP
jgi:lipopolysaccharide export system protein LptA